MEHSQDCTSTKETLENLTPLPGLSEWIRSQRDSLARTLAALEKVRESPVPKVDSGQRLSGAFAFFDPDSSSWKTPQRLLQGGFTEFSGTWPRWGTMRNGACWERTKLELHTSGTDGGALPTLTANTRGGGYEKGDMDLIDAMKTLPTLTSSDGTGGPCCNGREGGKNLRTTLPTLTAQTYGSNQGGASGREGQKKRPCLDKCLKTLPTLTSSMVTEADFIQAQYHSSKRPKYEDVKKLPTLLATDGSHSGPNQRDSKGRLALAAKLTRLPTLAATDYKGAYSKDGYQKQTEKRSKPLRDTAVHEIGIHLSPTFAEWYMGFPFMSTSTRIKAKGLKGSGTRKSRCKQRRHGQS